MREVKGNIWDYHKAEDTAVFITTNGTIHQSNAMAMGTGCAKEAKDRFPNIDLVIGEAAKKYGVQTTYFTDFALGVFPTKKQWFSKATIDLIEQSAKQLVAIANGSGWKTIVLPRPGCGSGGLDWDHDVKPVLQKYFDDRFIIVHK